MKINEVLGFLDSKNRYPYEIIPSTPKYIRARFRTEKNDYVDLLVVKLGTKLWNVAFSRNDAYDITDAGDQYKIFNTVFYILYQQLQTEQPKFLTFEVNTKERSRLRLYKTFIKRLLPRYFSNFVLVPDSGAERLLLPKTLKTSEIPDSYTFILQNKNY